MGAGIDSYPVDRTEVRGKRGNIRQHYHFHIMSTTTERLNLIWGWDQYINMCWCIGIGKGYGRGEQHLIHVACSVASHAVSSLNHHSIINRSRMYSMYSWLRITPYKCWGVPKSWNTMIMRPTTEVSFVVDTWYAHRIKFGMTMHMLMVRCFFIMIIYWITPVCVVVVASSIGGGTDRWRCGRRKLD